MTINRVKAVFAAGIVILFLLCSCGEMDLTLPISRNYQVSARGETYSLDEYAILKKNEKIQPFFVYPVNDDPDIASLTVSIKNSEGKTAGMGVRYALTSLGEADKTGADDTEEEFITLPLERMDGVLPFFSMPEGLEAGSYGIVFQVFGKKEVLLSKSEKNVYYMAGEDFSITDIAAYLPGLLTAPSPLIPPETVVLLEAKINAGKKLDPYIVWYSGKTVLTQGKVSEGANRALWQVPSQSGFQNIRAEVIPFPPISDIDSGASSNPGRILRGKAREISLPIAVEKETSEKLSGLLSKETMSQGKILWSYHPEGELEDPQNPLPDSTLLAWKPGTEDENKNRPAWIPARESFGLGIGPEDSYLLPPFTLERGSRATFMLRFASQDEGSYFTVSLNPGGTELVFSREEGVFFLTARVNDEEEQLPVEIPLREDFITLFLDFTFQEDSIVFTLKEDAEGTTLAEKALSQPDPADVQGLFRLGGGSGQDLPVMILGELCVVSFSGSGEQAAQEAVISTVP